MKQESCSLSEECHDMFTDRYEIKHNSITIRISGEYTGKTIKITSDKEEAFAYTKKISKSPDFSDVRATRVEDPYDNDDFYYIVSEHEFGRYFMKDAFVAKFIAPRIAIIGYKPDLEREAVDKKVCAYQNMIDLSNECVHACSVGSTSSHKISIDERETLDRQFKQLTSADKAIIDFDPKSVWYQTNIKARRSLLLKCAHEFVKTEFTGGESEFHDLFKACFVEGEYKIKGDGDKFTLIKTDQHYAGFDPLNKHSFADYEACAVRRIKLYNEGVVVDYHPMLHERTDNYRKHLPKTAAITRCAYCGHQYLHKYIEADHIIPVYAVSGDRGAYWKKYMQRHHYEYGVNSPQNIVPACIYCNRKKGKKVAGWFILGHIGRHEIVWWIRNIMLVTAMIIMVITSFDYNATGLDINIIRILGAVLIGVLWNMSYTVHLKQCEKLFNGGFAR